MNLSNITNELIDRAITSSDSVTEALNKLLYTHVYEGTDALSVSDLRYFYLETSGNPTPICIVRDEDGDICIGDVVTNTWSEIVIEDNNHLKQLNSLIKRVEFNVNLESNQNKHVKLILNTLRLKYPDKYMLIDDLSVDLKTSKFTVKLKDGIALTNWLSPECDFEQLMLKVILNWVK